MPSPDALRRPSADANPTIFTKERCRPARAARRPAPRLASPGRSSPPTPPPRTRQDQADERDESRGPRGPTAPAAGRCTAGRRQMSPSVRRSRRRSPRAPRMSMRIVRRRRAVIVRHFRSPHPLITLATGLHASPAARNGGLRGISRGCDLRRPERDRRRSSRASAAVNSRERRQADAQSRAADFRAAIGGLLAALERLVLLQFGLRLFLRGFGFLDLDREFGDRALEIVAARDRGARIGGIGEMMGIADPRALFLVGDFAIEIGRSSA